MVADLFRKGNKIKPVHKMALFCAGEGMRKQIITLHDLPSGKLT
jgi:hypothetical protein